VLRLLRPDTDWGFIC